MSKAPTRKSGHRRQPNGVRQADQPSLVRRGTLGALSWLTFWGSVGAGLAAAGFAIMVTLVAAGIIKPPVSAEGLVGFIPIPTLTPVPTATMTPTAVPPPEIAILAGHWSREDPLGVTTIHDTGALCEDGLREVSINKAVADNVVGLLRNQGYRVGLLEEFDPRLKSQNPDYAPTVLLAIHTDSCVHGPEFPYATGYKIAHALPSEVPEQDDRLVACLVRDYSAVVKPFKLGFNEFTITPDMLAYHAFREVVPTTPAAIIELGFMYNDRSLLTGHQEELGKGLADGLEAFVKGDLCGLPAESPGATQTPGL